MIANTGRIPAFGGDCNHTRRDCIRTQLAQEVEIVTARVRIVRYEREYQRVFRYDRLGPVSKAQRRIEGRYDADVRQLQQFESRFTRQRLEAVAAQIDHPRMAVRGEELQSWVVCI